MDEPQVVRLLERLRWNGVRVSVDAGSCVEALIQELARWHRLPLKDADPGADVFVLAGLGGRVDVHDVPLPHDLLDGVAEDDR